MATTEKFKDMGYSTLRTDPTPHPTGSLSHTDWQTPVVSGKSVSHFSIIKREGYIQSDGTCAENLKGFCGSSFHPIKNQIPIPTAHVLPSTLGMHPMNTCERLGPSALVNSNLPSFPNQPPSDPLASDDHRKFDTPNIEPTLNQSSLLQTLCTDQRPIASAEYPHVDHEPYRILPESRETASEGPVRIAGNKHLFSQGWRPEPYSHLSAEFSALRQQHEMDNIRIGMEQMQLARGHPPQLYPDHNGIGRVLKANGNGLLQELLVHRQQQQHISQMEQKLRQSEVQIHNTLLSPVNPYNDVYMIRLQELQREVTFLRAQFAEKNDSCNREKAELEKKLAACETEAKALKESAVKTSQSHTEELRKQEERVKARDRHINALKKKCQKEAEQNKEKQEKIETLERYLADLPTVNDHQKQTQELNGLQEKNYLLENQVDNLENKLGELRSFCREKETELASEKSRGKELLSRLHRYQEELEHYKAPGLTEEKRLTEETESLRQEVQTLQNERDCLKKVVENQKKKMEEVSCRVKELEEQISQEEGTGQVMKDEAQKKENALLQLKEAVKELAVQNQDLMEQNVYLEEQLQQPKTGVELTCIESQTVSSLYREMRMCLKELKSICSLLSQRAQGVDPNLSMMLGIHSTPVSKDSNEVHDSSSLDKYLSDIRQLKRDIDDLRTTISDRYAQDMGDNCTTQ